MKKILIVLMIIAFAIAGCNKVFGPFNPTQNEVCHAIDLEPGCEEWINYCFLKYIHYDMEDRQWKTSLIDCDDLFPYGGPDLDYFYPPYVD